MNINIKELKQNLLQVSKVLEVGYRVPVWQRGYVMSEQIANTFLLEDLNSLEDETDRYFYTAITYINNGNKYIADALQRLVTEGVKNVVLIDLAKKYDIKHNLKIPNIHFEDNEVQSNWNSFLNKTDILKKNPSNFYKVYSAFYNELKSYGEYEIIKLINNSLTKKYINVIQAPDEDKGFEMFNQLNNSSTVLTKEECVYSLIRKGVDDFVCSSFNIKITDFLPKVKTNKEGLKPILKNKAESVYKVVRAYYIFSNKPDTKYDFRKEQIISFIRKKILNSKAAFKRFKAFSDDYYSKYVPSNCYFIMNGLTSGSSSGMYYPLITRALSPLYNDKPIDEDHEFLTTVFAPLVYLQISIRHKGILPSNPHSSLLIELTKQIYDGYSNEDLAETVAAFLQKNKLYHLSQEDFDEFCLNCGDTAAMSLLFLDSATRSKGAVLKHENFTKEHINTVSVNKRTVASGAMVDKEEKEKCHRTLGNYFLLLSPLNKAAGNKDRKSKEYYYQESIKTSAPTNTVLNKIDMEPEIFSDTYDFYKTRTLHMSNYIVNNSIGGANIFVRQPAPSVA